MMKNSYSLKLTLIGFWEVFDGLKFTYERSLMHRCVDKDFEKFYNPLKALKSRFEKIK